MVEAEDDQIFAGQRGGRQREQGRMIISQQHARALHGAGVGEGGSGSHDAIYRRCWKSPILSKLTVFARTLARKNHAKDQATYSLRASKLLNRRCASA
jgi:hypothetical protein